MKKFSFDVVIPSYNGLSLLKKHLPDIIKFSTRVGRVIVVDNGSTDGTGEYLAANYSNRVTCFRNEKNLFFPIAVNQGFKASKSDFVVLINNDVHPSKGYLEAALPHFDDPLVFAVTLNETDSSWPQVTFDGKLQYQRGEDKTVPRYSAWASGGSAIFRKSTWDKLGGFDEIYTPGYWEDIDLGWRSWKAGYKIIWEPKANVQHQHESSFSKLKKNYVSSIKERNELIFNWKNITDPDLRREHLVYLIRHSLMHPGYLKVILSSLLSWPKIKVVKDTIRTDKEVLAIVNQPI